jgi:hypothetical protein
MSNPTSNFGWQMPTNTDLVSQLPADFEVFGQAVDTSLADLKGGTTGQVLSKASNTDMDFTWIAVDPLTILDAKGDLISATAADTPARLAVGTNGQVLTADSTTSTGLTWATPASGGKVLQVVFASYSTETNLSSSTYTDTGLTASITPSATTSKILVLVNTNGATTDATVNQGIKLKLVRASTDLAVITDLSNKMAGAAQAVQGESIGFTWLDSPSSTSALTYKTQYARLAGSGTVTLQNQMASNGSTSTITLIEIGA